MEYINQIKNRRRSSQILKAPNPVLTAEDEAFLQQVTAQPEPAPISPERADHATKTPDESSRQPAPDNQAQDIPLPVSPADDLGKGLAEEEQKKRTTSDDAAAQPEPPKEQSAGPPEKKKRWSSIFKRKKNPDETRCKIQDKQTTADKPSAKRSTSTSNSRAATPDPKPETGKDAEDMSDILERLNLAADNNRVFSISDETQELLRKFKLIFKDLVNGVPTAYHDLEMLLTNGNRQLQDTYTKLPGPLQKLIEKLPERWTESLAPEMLAAASARASQSGVNMENVGKAAAAAEKMGINMPSLKELVSKPAALVGMLRSIMAFLRARFPAVMGMNVLWSLALFLLLFVLWYCHKRGREVRLENERLVTEEEVRKLNEEDSADGKIRPTETLTTTAPQGASADEVREGVKKVEQARASTEPVSEPPITTASEENNARSAGLPTRSKSRLSIWGRSKPEPPPSNVTPYPGT
ncbi:hypothetical protein NUU61_003289 [Penicillium alfredii]|uniref:Uncharacterized protein n=1 Tax=Penicillium alfredii TaxID=1506179 RepID=A0A9W9FTA5_9EURO|nr:uncharacterized protein NUU61_003289 [Penicillium alfredii]KAJ5105942.1 hypothetical protein NUU61_003289 [Penicillium alfredii]